MVLKTGPLSDTMHFGLVHRVIKAFSFSFNSSALCDLVTFKRIALDIPHVKINIAFALLLLWDLIGNRSSVVDPCGLVRSSVFGSERRQWRSCCCRSIRFCTEHLAHLNFQSFITFFTFARRCGIQWPSLTVAKVFATPRCFMFSWTWRISLLANSPPSMCIGW